MPVKTNEPPQSTFLVSIDQLKAEDRLRHEPFHEMTPEKTFVRQWALTLLDRVMATLQAEASLKGKTQVFEEVRPVILGREAVPSYAQISAKLGLSETTLKVTGIAIARAIARCSATRSPAPWTTRPISSERSPP